MRATPVLFVVAAAALTGACSPYSPDLGPAPFLCGADDPKCPDGYTCMDTGSGSPGVCVAPEGTIPPDASNTQCADDSALEPNDTIQTAFQTPVATTKNTLSFAGLAICPSGDKDTYAVTITAENQNLEVIVTYDPAGAALQGSILNAGGTPIANASPVSGMDGTIRAYAANLPVGTYYAQAYGPSSGSITTNNYKLDLNVTGP